MLRSITPVLFITLLSTSTLASGCKPSTTPEAATSRAPETPQKTSTLGAKPKKCTLPAKPRDWAFDVLEQHLETCKGGACARVTLDGPITDEALSTLSDKACFPKIEALALTTSGIQDAQVEQLVKAKNIDGIKQLTLTQGVLGDEAAKTIANAPALKNLEVLDLSHNVIGARGVEAIFQSKNLANLHTLELALNRVGDARPVPTFDAPIKRQWKRLGLSRNDVGYEHVDAILASEHLAGLQELDLTGHGKFSDCLSKFAHAKRFGSLRRFEHNCYTITTSYRTMSESPHMVNLTHLDLYRGHIEDLSAFDGLMKSDRAKKLEEISIRETFFKDSSAVALISRAKALPALKVLELSDTTRKSKPTFEDTKRLFSSELLKQLKKFHYYGDWGPEHTALLADSAELRWLEELSIRASKSFDDSAAKQLAASPHLKNLRVLDLSSTKIGDEGVIALAKSPNTKNLRVLNLLHTKITDVGVAALAKSPHMANLEELSLSGEVSVMTKDSTIALARSPYINKLTKLDLFLTSAEDALHEFVVSGNFSRLKQLTFSIKNVPNEDIILMTRSPMWSALEEVDFHGGRLSNEAIVAIANAPGSNNIKRLRLNAVLDKGALAAFAAPKNLSRLSSLTLTNPWVNAAEAAPLLNSPLLAQLSNLDLSGCAIGDEGAKIIAERTLPRLSSLSLSQNKITSVGAKALAQSTNLKGIHTISLELNKIGEDGWIALSESPYLTEQEREYYSRQANRKPPVEATESTLQKLLP